MQKTLAHEAQNSDSSARIPDDSTSVGAKDQLLSDLDKVQRKEENIPFQTLVWTYIVLLFVLMFILPKIYIANQIYYISRDINHKYHKYTALIEENRHLRKKIEQLQYQSQVVDDITVP